LVEIQTLAEGLARKGEVKLDPRSPEYAEIHSKFVKVSELVDFGPGYSRRGGMELKRLLERKREVAKREKYDPNDCLPR